MLHMTRRVVVSALTVWGGMVSSGIDAVERKHTFNMKYHTEETPDGSDKRESELESELEVSKLIPRLTPTGMVTFMKRIK